MGKEYILAKKLVDSLDTELSTRLNAADLLIEKIMSVYGGTWEFDSNGGTGTMPNLVWLPGEPASFPECSFTPPTGKTFAGWSMSATDTSGVPAGDAGFSYSYGDEQIGRTLTFYAIWADA